MFGKKKLYIIKYKYCSNHSTIISARNANQALRIFYRKYTNMWEVTSVKEYKASEDLY